MSVNILFALNVALKGILFIENLMPEIILTLSHETVAVPSCRFFVHKGINYPEFSLNCRDGKYIHIPYSFQEREVNLYKSYKISTVTCARH